MKAPQYGLQSRSGMFIVKIVISLVLVALGIGLILKERKKDGALVLAIAVALIIGEQGQKLADYYYEWQADRTAEDIARDRGREGISDMARVDSPKQHYPPEIMAKIEKLEKIEKSGIQLHPKAYYEMGIAAYNQEEYREAARKLSIAVKLDESYIAAWNSLGLSYYVLGELDSASSCFETGLKLVQGRHLLVLEGNLLHNIASVHMARGELERAVEYYRASLNKYEPSRTANLSITYNSIAVAFHYLDLQDSASWYNDTSLALTASRDFHVRSAIFDNRAWVFVWKGMPDSALVYFKRAYGQDQKHNIRWIKASTLGGLGLVYYLKGDLNKADTLINRALDLDREVACREGEAKHLRFLALVHAKRGDEAKAVLCIDEALRINRDAGYLITEAEDYLAYGDLWRHLGHDERAKNYYVRALNSFVQMKMKGKVAESENKLRAVLWLQ